MNDDLRISVQTQFLPEQSDPKESRYFYAYQITLENRGDTALQLMSRHWVITDATGRIEEVRGPGVIGEQPVIAPGDAYRYTSFCPLPTDFGTMEGEYRMRRPDGSEFDAPIPRFILALDTTLN